MAGSEAQAGFYYRNIVAAQYALDLIEFGSQLRSITLENPQRAKHIDDIIANRTDGASFIQVKWSEDDTAAFTRHNLVTADNTSPPLIAQLARGFQQVSREPGRKEIILLSTKKAGTKRQPGRGFNKCLDEFLDELHKPFIAQAGLPDLRQVPSYAEYEPILERLRSASGLADLEELSCFLKCLRFRLNEPHRDTVAEHVRARLARLGIEQAQYATLLDHIVRWSVEDRLIRARDVLRALGLLDRFVDRLSHDFPVDRQVWVPTPGLFKALGSSLDALDRGFIFLEGEPGSGKSTALAMYRAYRADVLFGYYCFVPNDRTLGNERLQDDVFVHSIRVGLRNAFPDVEFPRLYAPHTLDLLTDWLHVLSRQGRRVVFIVDGVDHVDQKTRQSLVAHPLTRVLDGDVPSNVLIILSSQYLGALPPRLRAHVQSDARRHIQMSRFGRAQVREFFQLRGVSVADENLDAAVETSGGVPIYLEYLAERLSGMTRYEQKRFLTEVPSLRNKRIDDYHQHLWDTYSRDQEVVYILAILAVRDEFTTPEDLLDLLRILGVGANMFSVNDAVGKVLHALRVSEARSVSIQHNSFRDFVAERTPHLQQEINGALVTWYAKSPDRDEAWRHRFRRLFQLGEYSAVLAACDDEWLARSWANCRPIHEIQRNLDIAWRAAAVQKDLVEYIRIALLKQRVALVTRHLDLSDAQVGRLLLDMGRPKEALRHVWDGERPQCRAVEFAEFVLHYAQCIGRVPPQHLLEAGLGDMPASASPQELRTWYRACAYTRDPLKLVSEIDGMHWRTKKTHGHLRSQVAEDENRAINLSLQLAVVQELAERKDLNNLQRLRASDSVPEVVRTASRAAAALVLARVCETRDALTELEGLELSSIPAEVRSWLALGLAERGIEVSPGVAESGYPELPSQLLSPMELELDGQLFNLYDRLRIFFLDDEIGYPWLEAHTQGT